MKSVLTSAILLFVWSFLLAQPTFKYGNNNANYPSLIKNDGNNVYILGQEDKNGTSYGTITKLDVNSGNIIWQKELDFPSQINDMEFIPPQGPLGKTSLYIVGHTLPFDINNASFIVQINGETNAIECSNIFNQTGRESFRKIIRHSNPSNPNFPYYILGSKGIQGGSVTQDKVVLVNLRSFCSGGTNVNFVKEFSFFANPLDMEFSRGLTALSDGSILLMGNETNNGFGMAVKLTGAGNFVNGVTFSADMEVMDAVELPNFNIVFSGTRFSNSIQSGVLFVTDSKLAILGKAYENKNVLIYNDIVSETPGSYYLHSLYKPVQNSNNTSFPLIQKMFIGGSAALPSLAFLWQKSLENNAANGIYKGLSLTANFSGDLFYTDGRGLNNTNPDFTYAKSNSSFQLPCTDSLTTSLISFELGYNNIEITSSPATLPAPTQGNYRNTDWNRTAFCAEPCQLDFTISTTERECNNVLCNINIINGSLPYTLSWDFNCDGTVDATGIPAQYTFTSSGSHQVCIKVMDGKKCVKEKSFTIITNGDGEAPVLTCPDNITIQCNGSTDPSNTGIPTVTDNADSNPTLTALDDLVTENTPCLKKIVRSWKAEDDCKNESNCTQIITIKDENAPVFTSCGRKIEVQGIKDANGKCKEKVTLISPVVIDQCDSNPSIVNSYTNTNNATADYFEGETIVTWTATDQCGNKSVCRDTVIVNCDPCCINRQDFIDRVENAITFSINTEECQVSLSVNGLLSCDELTQINWGDGNLTNNITATTITHHYTGSGSYSINLFFTENNISGIRCFEYLIRKTVNIQCLCPEFGNLTITNNNTCVSDSIISSRTMTTINAPLPRSRSSLVWTGKEMIVWGGQSGFATYGSRYNLDLDIWNPISNINAPSHRVAHNALWTGKEMIIWGGLSTSGNIPLNDGAIYNPETDTWRSMDGTNAPLPTNAHSAIWTGKEMIIYGGILWATNTFVGTDTGSKYNITTDTWESITTGGGNRLDHSTFWDGTTMYVSGGLRSQMLNDQFDVQGNVHGFDPETNTWPIFRFLNERRYDHQFIIRNNFIYFAGGLKYSSQNAASGTRSVVKFSTNSNVPIVLMDAPSQLIRGGLSKPKESGFVSCNTWYFAHVNPFQFFNFNSETWTTFPIVFKENFAFTGKEILTWGSNLTNEGNIITGFERSEIEKVSCGHTLNLNCVNQKLDLNIDGYSECSTNTQGTIDWSLKDVNGTMHTSGSSNYNYHINLQGLNLTNGLYTLEIKKICEEDTCSCLIYLNIQDCISSTKENGHERKDVTTYPNPTSGQFTLDFKNGNTAFDNALIYDLHGRWIKTIPLAKGMAKQEIDLFHNENGIYLIRLVDNKGQGLVKKIVKIN